MRVEFEGMGADKSACSPRATWMKLYFAAVIAMVVHFIAGLSMALILRYGLDTERNFLHRIHYLDHNYSFWVGAWIPWTAAALSILYFYFCFARAHNSCCEHATRIFKLAITIGVLAVLADLSAQFIEVFTLPQIAGGMSFAGLGYGTNAHSQFLSLSRDAVLLTGGLANGLYTLAAAMLIFASGKDYNLMVLAAGILVVIGGAWLSIAACLNKVEMMVCSNLLLIPALLFWLDGVARHAWRQRNV